MLNADFSPQNDFGIVEKKAENSMLVGVIRVLVNDDDGECCAERRS